MRKKWLTLVAVGLLLLFAACTPGQIENESSPTEQPALIQDVEETPINEEAPMEEPKAESTAEPVPVDEGSEAGEAGEELPDREERLIKATIPPGLERVPAPEAPVVGEVPDDLMAAVFEDIKTNQNADADDVEVIRAQSTIWRDGSLGCPQPGMMYTQALVPGYWIVLRHGEVEYDYRMSDNGAFFLCENAPPGQTGGTAPTS